MRKPHQLIGFRWVFGLVLNGFRCGFWRVLEGFERGFNGFSSGQRSLLRGVSSLFSCPSQPGEWISGDPKQTGWSWGEFQGHPRGPRLRLTACKAS